MIFRNRHNKAARAESRFSQFVGVFAGAIISSNHEARSTCVTFLLCLDFGCSPGPARRVRPAVLPACQTRYVVVILRAREPARIMTAIGNKKQNRWHLQIAQRWVIQYNFYVNDRRWGPMFVRMCPYFPFPARICLNQHHWLANRMWEEGLTFRQCTNVFLSSAEPKRLQQLADSLTAQDLLSCGRKWLAAFTPFFKPKERQVGCQHNLFFEQVVSSTPSCVPSGTPCSGTSSL